jgi:hypothetical protein
MISPAVRPANAIVTSATPIDSGANSAGSCSSGSKRRLAISPTAPHTIISNGTAIERGSPIPMPNRFSALSQSSFSAAAWSSWLE